MVETTDSYRHN